MTKATTQTVEPIKRFNASDVGRWIDGAFGLGDVMSSLFYMLHEQILDDPKKDGPHDDELLSVLESGDIANLSDDHGELDQATELLQEHTADGLVWMWDAGDLILTTEDQIDD